MIKTKRGNVANERGNKLAQGFSKMATAAKTVSHPSDSSFTKKVKVLGKAGNSRLKALRKARIKA